MRNNMIKDTAGTATGPAPIPVRGLIRSIAHRLADEQVGLADEGRLASFDGATSWLNSEPLTLDGLRGRVVLVDFWTYTASTGFARFHASEPGTRSIATTA
jgi:hypothetical protein